MIRDQFLLDIQPELIVDLFAGGGGASTGIEMALGRHVDIAVNHNPEAISMHEINHPQTEHFISDVFEVDPRVVTQGRPIGLLHASPDCTHHSQARGGQPRSRAIRALSWVVLRWAGQVRPRVITLENVEQILQWSPLVAKRCKATGRVMKLDGTVAERGERVPLDQQFLVPDAKRKGRNWDHFVGALRALGYAVQWKVLCAADFGAPTTRERLFMVARCDGRPIVWPEPTHAKKPSATRKKWRAAAECIDFSIPCPSIFTRKKPLADATMRRIFKGVDRFVLNCADPFIVPLTHQGADRLHSVHDPLRTITAANRGELALATPIMVQTGYGERDGQAPRVLDIEKPLGTIVAGGCKFALAVPTLVGIDNGSSTGAAWDGAEPLTTITTENRHALTVAYLAQQNGGFNTTPGHELARPMMTITNSGSQQQLVTAHLATLRRNCVGRGMDEPVSTLTAGAEHHAVVECTLSPELEEGALRVASFLMLYYGEGSQHGSLRNPAPTITTRDRLALVTVVIRGTPYVIVDIGLRMLKPRELYLAQGFPARYIIDRGADGRKLTGTAQVRMVGNSVSPEPEAAVVRVNVPELAAWGRRERAAVAA